MRSWVLALGLIALLPAQALAQQPAAAPPLEPLTADELAALRPMAERGVALIVRDPEAGTHARITAVVRVHAPLAVIHDIVANPERYPEFSSSVSNVQILSRFQNRIGVRMHTSVAIFTVDTLMTLHLVNPRRIDGVIMQSQLGPGAFRWDLYADGDDTWLAYTSSGDPSQGNWFLQQLARLDPSATAGMLMSYDAMLVLLVGRRAENLSGRHFPGMASQAVAAPGAITPPALGPWVALAHGRAVASIALDANGSTTQGAVAIWTPAPLDAVRARLEDVAHYGRYWSAIRALDVVSTQQNTVRFHTRVDSTLFHTEGEQDRVIENAASGPVVYWRGASGDYANDVQRWDLSIAPGGGTIVMLSGGADYNRAGMIVRALVDRVPWMLPGYAAAWKMVWMLPVLRNLPSAAP